MLIRWAESARADLRNIFDYYLSINEEDAGKNIVSTLIKSVNRLEKFPLSGKKGSIAGVYEIIPPRFPYILLYQLPDNERVEIISVIHTSKLRDNI